MPLDIQVGLAPKIGFASHQNSVPVLHDLELRNNGAEPLADLVVRLSADPAFLESKIWKIDRLEPGTEVRVRDREIRLEAGFLAELGESLRGAIHLEVRQGEADGERLVTESHAVELLAKTHWGGTGSMPELLPAFCMPNDPAVDRILKAAGEVLRRAGKEAGIDGYEKRSRSRTWELVSAIWSAVAALELGYVLPPASFETGGQKVRTPGAILEGRVATCLDTSMLFASALEQAGLNPLVILTEGHAFTGVWLQPQEFSQLTTDEAAALRKRVELQELLVFETTLVTSRPAPSFSRAVEAAKAKLTDEEFHLAIDIRRARMRKIRPLGLTAPAAAAQVADEAPPSEALEEAPALPGFDVEIREEPGDAGDRVDQWQRKLLDLTARNRLLHLPEKSKHVPLLCPDPGALEDLLAAGRTIRIAPLPDLAAGGRDAALYEQRNQTVLREEYARQAMESHEVLSPLADKKLEADLIDLYRKANSDIAEGGANTLFLALGFLNWKKSAEDPRTYRAPLILMPVRLKRKSALSGVTMTAHEDEPRFNLTLLELLKQDFELVIPGLDGELPEDESGIDVAGIWNRVRVAVKEIPGFEVTTETAVSTFSFSKYLMWKDLTDRREDLMTNKAVRHLIERGEEKFGGDPEFPREHELDDRVRPSELFTPLPADSSQLAAVVASGAGCNFVLDGPPGTGKSQTIANMIVHNLSLGRRVLFVAEKMAALNVVYRRLEEKGLARFCLEVHSHKSSKQEILQQLDEAWETRSARTDEEWSRETARLRHLRDRLNAVCERLHHRHTNGLSVHEAMGRAIRDAGSATPRLRWAEGTVHSREEYEEMRDTARRLDLNREALNQAPESFAFIRRSEWSNQWQEGLLAAARDLPGRISALLHARDRLIESCGLELEAGETSAMERLASFARVLLRGHGKDLAFAFAPDVGAKHDAADSFLPLLAGYRNEEEAASIRYGEEAVRKIDVDAFEATWKEAGEKFWILGKLARKKTAKDLAARAGADSRPDVAEDLKRLRRMRESLAGMDALDGRLKNLPGYGELRTDSGVLAEAVELSRELNASFPALASTPDELAALKAAARQLVVDANGMLAPGGAVEMAADALESALRDFHAASGRFSERCGREEAEDAGLAAMDAAARAVTEHETRLRAWCGWQRVRGEALRQNLGALVEGVETGGLPADEAEPAFEVAYAKWFAADAMDREPVLREFVSAEHDDLIEDFRRVDDKVAELTAAFARARLAGGLPAKDAVGKRDGYGILKHELQKKRRHKPLRQLAAEMGEAFGALAPCMLMSPLSIAQYLPPDQELFDLVIFDEASQIAPWDAVGSIARGKQVVIAGDPRQMPPTNFFQRGAADQDVEGTTEGDLESILDEALAVGIPRHGLSWHYRSRHESLIAFSNHCYYGNSLITFPAAGTRESAVAWRNARGTYAKGKARTNQAEAEAVAAETVARLRDPEFNRAGRTLGIITLNADQQKLIEDLLDRARTEDPEIEGHFDASKPEPVVVKNLETVQGDERDVILLSVGYGPSEPGAETMSMNFGPLNRDGGERRLNVALTRSKREMVVFTSFDPAMIDLNRTGARAVRDLKHFLEFAERGPRALGEAVHGSVGGFESPFEEAVADRLSELGWEIVPQVGVSRFRVDLGVVHPDEPGSFLAGVECDGATYHRAATARDRDKVRAAALEGLGWTLLRVWSTDWFTNPAYEADRLHARLDDLLATAREEAEKARVADPPPAPDGKESASAADQAAADLKATGPAADRADASPPAASQWMEPRTYRPVDFAPYAATIDPVRFHEEAYTDHLRELVRHTLHAEAPMTEELLVRRIARAHDFKRTGRRIRERVLTLADEAFHLRDDPAGGSFVWLDPETAGIAQPARFPAPDEEARGIEEIPAEELRSAFAAVDGEDPVREVARLFGTQRLSAAGRERIEVACREARTHG